MSPSIFSDPNADLPPDDELEHSAVVEDLTEDEENEKPQASATAPSIVSDHELSELLKELYRKTRESLARTMSPLTPLKPVFPGGIAPRGTGSGPSNTKRTRKHARREAAKKELKRRELATAEQFGPWGRPTWHEGEASEADFREKTLEDIRLKAGGRRLKWSGRAAFWDITREGGVKAAEPERPRSPFWKNPFTNEPKDTP